jgi:hypothetical protein
MADVHHVLLLWFHILGLCLPSLLFVSLYRSCLSLQVELAEPHAFFFGGGLGKQHALQPHARRVLLREP